MFFTARVSRRSARALSDIKAARALRPATAVRRECAAVSRISHRESGKTRSVLSGVAIQGRRKQRYDFRQTLRVCTGIATTAVVHIESRPRWNSDLTAHRLGVVMGSDET